ncbi:type II toxin-antitoxin system VapC family toxin [Mucilaginibacter antarcticus]|uniref:Type II toxin-antitoxin system VapC family toxin n=2 Tax=Mucilaginibacter antarcticus TaxID=1855725 RepID=A0ABW5XMW7_9SPHI
MDFILDTHTFIWFINGEALPKAVKDKIKNINNRCFLSIASIWEIAIKSSLGKLTMAAGFDEIASILSNNNIEVLPITLEHIQQLIKLPYNHNDPFDRLIISQSIAESAVVLTVDTKFKLYPINVQWG